MTKDLHAFYLKQDEPNRGCFLALRDILLNHQAQLHETIKYGMPCFCFGKKAICYLWKDKKSNIPYILFVDGNRLNHVLLESGDRARMKILWVDANQDIPIQDILDVLNSAIYLHKK